MLLYEQVRMRELPSLIDALCKHLTENGYSEKTIRNVRNTIERFCRFSIENKIEVLDSFSVQSFITYNYGDDYQDKYYSWRITRPFGMLTDYLRFGTVIRQKYSKETFAEEFEPLFQSFLNYLERRNYAADSIKICRSHLLRFQHFLLCNNICALDKISSDIVKNYCDSLASYSTTANCQIIRELRHLFTYAKTNDYMNDDLSAALPHIKNTRAQRLPDIFTPEEINKILGVIDRDNPMGKRDYAIVITAVRLGLRNCDVISLKFRAVDWAKKEIHIVQKKTGVPLTLPLPEDVGWAIIDYIKNARPDSDSDSIFVGFNPPYGGLTIYSNLVAKYMRKAGLYSEEKRRAGMHTLRKSLATSMLENDVPVPVIAQTLGHGDLNTVGSYIRVSIKLLKKCAMEVDDFE
ncbi:MAG: site-specific integrase [Acutalibacteraceae bacterium]|nr:site-specific integrase [Acutalibacteraceae bacterium]